ncbi:MAG TPA: response regulator [Tepidisphaeraceae bacterium]|nr:response regulator [Tepidisphaeraceae bacterium]
MASIPPYESHFNVLVVDDHDDTRAALVRLIRHSGYSAAGVSDGHQALAILEITQPKVIFLDYHLPEIDGLEILRRIRQQPTLAAIPVVMFTAADPTVIRPQAIEFGADDFILKGANAWSSVLDCLTRLIDSPASNV